MAESKPLRRLLHVLSLQEEIRRRELESTQNELIQSERSLAVAHRRENRGRQLLMSSLYDADPEGRIVAAEEIRAGRVRAVFLQNRIQQLNSAVDERRRVFREKQVERKQAETLVAAADASEALEEDRRGQRSVDDWFLMCVPNDRANRDRQESQHTSVEDDCEHFP